LVLAGKVQSITGHQRTKIGKCYYSLGKAGFLLGAMKKKLIRSFKKFAI
jgi:hypothetical protein